MENQTPINEQLHELNELMAQVSIDPFDRDIHIKCMKVYQTLNEREELRKFRARMIEHVAPTTNMWHEWLSDEFADLKDNLSIENCYMTLFFCEKYCLLQPSSDAWLMLLEALALIPENVLDKFRTKGEKGMVLDVNDPLICCTFEMNSSAKESAMLFVLSKSKLQVTKAKSIFDKILEMTTGTSQDWAFISLSDKTKEFVKTLFIEQIFIPHHGMEETFSSYSNFLTNFYPDHYEDLILSVNGLYSKALKLYRTIEDFEKQINDSSDISESHQSYFAYLNRLLSEKNTHYGLISSLFERLLEMDYENPHIWKSYLLSFSQDSSTYQLVFEERRRIAFRSCIFCPRSGMLLGLRLQTTLQTSREIAELDKHMIEGLVNQTLDECLKKKRIINMSDAIDFCESVYESLELFYARFYKESVLDGQKKLKNDFVTSIKKKINQSMAQLHRKGHAEDRPEGMQIAEAEFLGSAGLIEEAEVLWKNIEKYHYKEETFWLQKAYFLEKCGRPPVDMICNAVFKRLSSHQHILNYMFFLARRLKTVEEVQKVKFNLSLATQLYAHELIQNTKNVEAHAIVTDDTVSNSKKRKHEDIDLVTREDNRGKEIHLDRENLTIIITNLLNNTSEEAIRKAFADCGQIMELKMIQASSKEDVLALITFQTEDDLLSALTKDRKLIEGQEISVQRSQSILFVTGFDPRWGKDEISTLFSKHGTVVEVRLPSLTVNNHRRFCYVQMAKPEDCNAALELDGLSLGNFTLSVKISDPANKKEREGPIAERREIYIRNVDFKVDKEAVRKFFEKSIGGVLSVRLPTKAPMHRLHYGYAYVTFQKPEQATEALTFNGKLLGSRILNIVISEFRNKNSNNAKKLLGRSKHLIEEVGSPENLRDEITKQTLNERSIAISKVPHTVSTLRLQSICEKYGKVIRIDSYPERQTMIVEFASVKAAGDAALALQSYEIEGSTLEISTVNEAMGRARLSSRRIEPVSKIHNTTNSQETKLLSFHENIVKASANGHKGPEQNGKFMPRNNDYFKNLFKK